MNGHWDGCDDPYNPVMAHGQRGNFRPGRLPLFGIGLAAVAVAAVVGIGQLAGGQTACSRPASAADSSSAMSLSAMSLSAMSLSAMSEQSGTVSGIATHYVLTGLPNCSYPSPPADGLFAALPPPEYDGAAACGGYLTITGPDGSVTVQVIDQCPDCAAGHIDLSEPAFARLAPLSAGLINVRYRYLADPPLPGPITMEVKSGSSQYWLALLADDTGNPLASVQVQTAAGGWTSLARASYNYWIAPSGAGSGPFTVRLTDTQGNQVTVHDVALDPGAVQSTGVYMYGTGSDRGTPAPSPSSSSSSVAVSPAVAGAHASTSASTSASATAAASGAPAAARQRPRATPAARPTIAPTRSPTPSSTC